MLDRTMAGLLGATLLLAGCDQDPARLLGDQLTERSRQAHDELARAEQRSPERADRLRAELSRELDALRDQLAARLEARCVELEHRLGELVQVPGVALPDSAQQLLRQRLGQARDKLLELRQTDVIGDSPDGWVELRRSVDETFDQLESAWAQLSDALRRAVDQPPEPDAS